MLKSRGSLLKYFVIAAVAFALLLPYLVTSPYIIHLAIMAMIYIVLVSGLNLMAGYCGQVSLGHAAFFGIGAYTSTLLALKLNVPVFLGFLMAGLVAALFGLFVGYITLKIRGPYFVIVTLAFAEIIHLIVLNWDKFTRGPMGISRIPYISLGSLTLDSRISNYYFILLLAFFSIFIVYRLVYSNIGHAFLALREDESLAQSIGIHPFKYYLYAVMTATGLAGFAGSFYAHYITFISPEVFALNNTITMIIMMIVGGQSTIVGPIVGAVLFTTILEYFRMAEQFRMPIIGMILILTTIFLPEGIYPNLSRLWKWCWNATGISPGGRERGI